MSKGTLRIVHTRADGTILHGSRKGDGVWDIVRAVRGWHWSRNVGLYIRHSRDRAADRWTIDTAAEALRAAGWTVQLDIDNTTPGRPVAQVEAERRDAARERAARFAARAWRNTSAGNARWEATRARMQHLPPGQPILVGSSGERGHRRLLRWADTQDGRAVTELRKGRYWAGRAEGATANQAHREDVGTTRRRIDRLQADRRRLASRLEDGWTTSIRAGVPLPERCKVLDTLPDGTRWCRVWPSGERLASDQADLAHLDEQITYWQGRLAAAEQAGVKVWTRADFTKHDFVIYMGHAIEVMRVNPKSVTIPWGIYWAGSGLPLITVEWAKGQHRFGGPLNTATVPYDKVQGRLSAEEGRAAAGMSVADVKALINRRFREARGLPAQDTQNP
ncbi:DUF3560 domain-containing protein [Microbispora cellulosiformans]|uniref:DUF3560 domain-containing protein n=1 Tax=Microbispora cellulosiformans TaxID=2614688 RepID=A0A5J5K7A5_9ACTN|nr:DUF3560 domain-containing protein [Microbispora cellulosiformans]KAA9379678.1 DUF3560 domain-containing protein [Microbispora cellulosiformans]